MASCVATSSIATSSSFSHVVNHASVRGFTTAASSAHEYVQTLTSSGEEISFGEASGASLRRENARVGVT
jgi:hypothetical protein